jgi:hypothetical protein
MEEDGSWWQNCPYRDEIDGVCILTLSLSLRCPSSECHCVKRLGKKTGPLFLGGEDGD